MVTIEEVVAIDAETGGFRRSAAARQGVARLISLSLAAVGDAALNKAIQDCNRSFDLSVVR